MLDRFINHIAEQHLIQPKCKVLLAVSGGRDSVVMTHLSHRASIPFAIAHCNFHLRPDECDRDEAFVRSLALSYGVELHVASFDTRAEAASKGVSVEEAARMLRYEWFANLCHEHGYSCLATAHHRDDSVETFFLNLLRGTGISGLHGILPVSTMFGRLTVIRPMLPFSRDDINKYVSDYGLSYVEDSSNAIPDVRRNWIRLQLMPLLREKYSHVDATIERDMRHLHGAEMVFRSAIGDIASRVMEGDAINVEALHAAVEHYPQALSTVIFELLRPYGFNAMQVEQISKAESTGSVFLSPTHRITIDRGRYVIAPIAPAEVSTFTVKVEDTSISPSELPADGSAILVDSDLLTLPLTVRPWSAGDRFHPFGMKGSKLVSDFLKDCRVSPLKKPFVSVVLDASGRIVWVAMPGVVSRADNRFRVTYDTRRRALVSFGDEPSHGQ